MSSLCPQQRPLPASHLSPRGLSPLLDSVPRAESTQEKSLGPMRDAPPHPSPRREAGPPRTASEPPTCSQPHSLHRWGPNLRWESEARSSSPRPKRQLGTQTSQSGAWPPRLVEPHFCPSPSWPRGTQSPHHAPVAGPSGRWMGSRPGSRRACWRPTWKHPGQDTARPGGLKAAGDGGHPPCPQALEGPARRSRPEPHVFWPRWKPAFSIQAWTRPRLPGGAEPAQGPHLALGRPVVSRIPEPLSCPLPAGVQARPAQQTRLRGGPLRADVRVGSSEGTEAQGCCIPLVRLAPDSRPHCCRHACTASGGLD